MRNSALAALVVLGAFAGTYAEKAKGSLQLDYTARPNWIYALDYESTCMFEEKGKKTEKSTKVGCTVEGVLSEEKDKVVFSIKDLSVGSQLYDKGVVEKLSSSLTSQPYDLPIEDGQPSVEGIADLSAKGVPEWNFYVQFAELLPEMPGQPARKGLKWERSGELEVTTAGGKTPCEVYREFKIDRMSAEHDTAFISWQFTYSAAAPKKDSTLLTYVPVAGKGSGSAVVNVSEGYILSATMSFETPVAKVDKTKVSWKETASIALTTAD